MPFKIPINIPNPTWGSSLTINILDLEKLRSKKLVGEIPVHIFFQLKDIFQILETLGSARIEGNNTTLSEYVEKIISKTDQDEEKKEIDNLEEAIHFIEENTDENTTINRAYLSHLHKTVTYGLTREGSKTPGILRNHNVTINKSNHIPPDHTVIPEYFEGFIKFINKNHTPQYQLLMVAIAHHSFAYLHPFDNGNGRMGRLLTYALLIKLGFKVKKGRIINPSSVFYSNREKYYDMLGIADSLRDEDILKRSDYFLGGLKNEIEKIDSLLSKEYVTKVILLPAINIAREREHITEMEKKILHYLVNKPEMEIKSKELGKFDIKKSDKKSRIIKGLRNKNILLPTTTGGRIYTINFVNSYLLRAMIKVLTDEGFVSDFLQNNDTQ